MSDIKISIVIPVHNTAKFLAECLDSLVAQIYPNWEAICVDDGSTDGSGSILDEYARKDGRFRVVHKASEGVSIARNVAIGLASGEWVGFLDSDDVILPNWLQAVQSVVDKENPDYVRMGFTKWYGESNYPQAKVLSQRTEVVNDNAWGWKLFPGGGWVWVGFVKNEILRESHARFPDGMRLSEDTIFGLQIVPYVKKCCYVECAGYLYRMRGTSAVFSRRSVEDCRRFCEELNAIWNEQKDCIPDGSMEACRKSSTRAVAQCIVVWERIKETGDGQAYQKVVAALKDCVRDGSFVLSQVSPIWRTAFRYVISRGSFRLMSAENAVIRAVRRFLIKQKWSQ